MNRFGPVDPILSLHDTYTLGPVLVLSLVGTFLFIRYRYLSCHHSQVSIKKKTIFTFQEVGHEELRVP